MALILDNDLLCIERGGRSYKWSGAELKSQITGLAPIASITGTNPIVVSQQSRDATISINDATTGQKGATILTNTVDNTQTKALTPKGAKDQLDLKANKDGSNATGTWNINITGTSPGSDNSTNSVNSQNIKVDTDSSSNSTHYLTFTDGGGGSNRRLRIDGNLKYNPSTNVLTASTFTGNLNGTASSATSATNAVNSTNATNATNVNVLSDADNTIRYLNFSSTTSGNTRIRAHTELYYKPSTGTLTLKGLDVENLSVDNFSLGADTDITCRNLTATGNINNSSDFNLKEDIEVITGAVESLKQINGVTFTWKFSKEKGMGVIAQDVEKVLPDIVNTDEDGLKSVNYNGIIGALVEAVKELSARVEELEASK